MTFEAPESRTDTATHLRDLEQDAPKPTSKEIRAAMIQAAKELEDWRRLAEDASRELDEAASIHISQLASQSKVDEIQRQVKLTLQGLAQRFRAKL
jgi:hypothetical protein